MSVIVENKDIRDNAKYTLEGKISALCDTVNFYLDNQVIESSKLYHFKIEDNQGEISDLYITNLIQPSDKYKNYFYGIKEKGIFFEKSFQMADAIMVFSPIGINKIEVTSVGKLVLRVELPEIMKSPETFIFTNGDSPDPDSPDAYKVSEVHIQNVSAHKDQSVHIPSDIRYDSLFELDMATYLNEINHNDIICNTLIDHRFYKFYLGTPINYTHAIITEDKLNHIVTEDNQYIVTEGANNNE